MSVDVLGTGLTDRPGAQDGACVVLRLEQSGHEVRLVRPDEYGRALQTDVHGEPAREDVVEALPPAGTVRLLRQEHEGVGLLVGDAVRLQQQLDVRDLQRDLGHLHPADGRGSDAEDLGGLLALQSRAFTQVLEAAPEHDLPDGRRGPRFAHVHLRRVTDDQAAQNGGPNWGRFACCCEQCAMCPRPGTLHSAIFRVTLAKCSRRGDSGKRDSVRAVRNRGRRNGYRCRGSRGVSWRSRQAPLPLRIGRTSGFSRSGPAPHACPTDRLGRM